MIFLIKHRWWQALLATAALALLAYLLGGWRDLLAGSLGLPGQVLVGLAGGLVALAINGLLHEVLKRVGGMRYLSHFEIYRQHVLDGMRWPEYLAAGIMAAVGEEPLFRGVMLRWFDNPIVGILVAALLFALCHWLRWSYFGYWLWGMWEGILFGILLVVTGSLLVPMVAHGLHDVLAYRVLRSLGREKT